VAHISEWLKSEVITNLENERRTTQQQKMPSTNNEAGIILAMEAFERREGVSIASTAKVYNVSQKTLARRLRGTSTQRDTIPKSKKLTATEEKVIVDFMLDLDARAFPP
jgi:hypothetical protein